MVPLKTPSQRNDNNVTRQQKQHDDKRRTWASISIPVLPAGTHNSQRGQLYTGEHIIPGVSSRHARESARTTAPGRAFQGRLTLRARTRVGENNRTRASIPRPVDLFTDWAEKSWMVMLLLSILYNFNSY